MRKGGFTHSRSTLLKQYFSTKDPKRDNNEERYVLDIYMVSWTSWWETQIFFATQTCEWAALQMLLVPVQVDFLPEMKDAHSRKPAGPLLSYHSSNYSNAVGLAHICVSSNICTYCTLWKTWICRSIKCHRRVSAWSVVYTRSGNFSLLSSSATGMSDESRLFESKCIWIWLCLMYTRDAWPDLYHKTL